MPGKLGLAFIRRSDPYTVKKLGFAETTNTILFILLNQKNYLFMRVRKLDKHMSSFVRLFQIVQNLKESWQ